MLSNGPVHSFHIPVMGLGFTVDTPLKVARFGISSVVSIIQDTLLEQMRKHYCEREGLAYEPVPKSDLEHRWKRILLYLDLMHDLVERQMQTLRSEPFEEGNEIVKYFELLPDKSELKKHYREMMNSETSRRSIMEEKLRRMIAAGSIDVNIMTKIDNPNYDKQGRLLPPEYSDAMAALKGFAMSKLRSSLVLSAGLNPRLFGYMETFPDFFPDERGDIKKKIILKVSDYRSALIQGKFLAKKGLWVSEFRIESGLNCGGHAFPTDGYLLGPILEEFKEKREALSSELFELSEKVLAEKGKTPQGKRRNIKISVQGGIGTAAEDTFLREHYGMDATGWGSPFLLVPEATNVDEQTLSELVHAKENDYYLSHASPLGIPFNNFRKSSSEVQRKARIKANRPGSPCYKRHLAFNTEFSEHTICTASREYQHLKIAQLADRSFSNEEYTKQFEEITEKDCLCEGLSVSALLKNNIPDEHQLKAVTICPGPNLAYFSGVFSLKDMVDHIYGRKNILNGLPRPHVFIKELKMYVDHFMNGTRTEEGLLSEKQSRYFSEFKSNLLNGIEYYKKQFPVWLGETGEAIENILAELENSRMVLRVSPVSV